MFNMLQKGIARKNTGILGGDCVEKKYKRLAKSLEFLKGEYFEVGEEWAESRNSDLFHELNGLLEAINWIEIYLYDKKITSLLDIP